MSKIKVGDWVEFIALEEEAGYTPSETWQDRVGQRVLVLLVSKTLQEDRVYVRDNEKPLDWWSAAADRFKVVD